MFVTTHDGVWEDRKAGTCWFWALLERPVLSFRGVFSSEREKNRGKEERKAQMNSKVCRDVEGILFCSAAWKTLSLQTEWQLHPLCLSGIASPATGVGAGGLCVASKGAGQYFPSCGW